MDIDTNFYSNGKLLLTGEYVVLDGAKALAIPTTYGQHLKVSTIDSPVLEWLSYTYKNNAWLTCSLDEQLNISKASNATIAQTLRRIIKAAIVLNPDFKYSNNRVITTLDFPRKWGLGTSSTLVNNVAQWAHVNPYDLLHLTFGGSGYDIACAMHNSPIIYTRSSDSQQKITPVNFNPTFKNHLYFVYLNKKQNSREGIARYKSNTPENTTTIITEISKITEQLVCTESISEFQYLLNSHENVIAKTIKLPTVKSLLFDDFDGCIKSLGAWGGDFILVCSEENPENYFKNKGFKTIISYHDMILNP